MVPGNAGQTGQQCHPLISKASTSRVNGAESQTQTQCHPRTSEASTSRVNGAESQIQTQTGQQCHPPTSEASTSRVNGAESQTQIQTGQQCHPPTSRVNGVESQTQTQMGQQCHPPTSEASTSRVNGAESQTQTFDSYLRQRKNNPGCVPPRFTIPLEMRSNLLKPAWCTHCKRLEDLSSVLSTTLNPIVFVHTVSLPDADAPEGLLPRSAEVALEGRSCFSCAEDIYKKTGHLQDKAPAGSGGNTPLHHAARSGNLRMLFHLITLLGEEAGHHRVVKELRKTNDRGETAMHMAVSVGDKNMVKLLLWMDPQLGQIKCHDTSPIYLAVSQGDKDIAQALHDTLGPNVVRSYSGPSGQNALHAAVLHGEGMTQMVLDWNKNLSTQKDQNGSTPLHFAVSVKQRHPYIRIWCFWYTWFQLQQNDPTWHLLKADSSMAYQPDNEGLLPVHVAAMTNRKDAVRILLTKCPRCMGLRDNQGRTFLHVAVQHKGFSVVRYACGRSEFAPIMNIQDNNGNTALHLAVDAENLQMFCYLLTNTKVCLNLRNNKGQTALDLARSHIRKGFFYARNPDILIYRTLISVGAKHSSCRWDKLTGKQESSGPPPPGGLGETEQPTDDGELDKEESAKLTDSTRTLAIGSVLIATMTFSATFARLPGGYKVDPAGTPTLASKWYFDAFMVANALAFILSSMATFGLMYSGMAMVKVPIRRKHFVVSLFFVSSSVTCLTIAFALGVYMVLAPVARSTAIAICAISPLLLIYRNVESLQKIVAVSGPMLARRGFLPWLMQTGLSILLRMLMTFWPFLVIFGWAGHLRNQQQHA
ncbi:unnamed protein product [Urochloa humidicola]